MHYNSQESSFFLNCMMYNRFTHVSYYFCSKFNIFITVNSFFYCL